MKSDVKKKMTSLSHPATTPKSLDLDEGEYFARSNRREYRVRQIFFVSSDPTEQSMIVFYMLDFVTMIPRHARIVCA
jgi:hypothetical protein